VDDLITLARERFGKNLGEHLLWEETCFPFSEEIAMDQLKYLIAKADRGEDPTLDGWTQK